MQPWYTLLSTLVVYLSLLRSIPRMTSLSDFTVFLGFADGVYERSQVRYHPPPPSFGALGLVAHLATRASHLTPRASLLAPRASHLAPHTSRLAKAAAQRQQRKGSSAEAE